MSDLCLGAERAIDWEVWEDTACDSHKQKGEDEHLKMLIWSRW